MEANNMKEMREALIKAKSVIHDAMVMGLHGESVDEAFYAICAALTLPPRNCDIHKDFNDAITTIANKRNWHDGKWDSERYCIFASWLFAPVEDTKGASNER